MQSFQTMIAFWNCKLVFLFNVSISNLRINFFRGGRGHSEINNRYNCILFEKNIQNKKQ